LAGAQHPQAPGSARAGSRDALQLRQVSELGHHALGPFIPRLEDKTAAIRQG